MDSGYLDLTVYIKGSREKEKAKKRNSGSRGLNSDPIFLHSQHTGFDLFVLFF